MKENEYKCYSCKEIFEKGWSDDDAIKECAENFGEGFHESDDAVIVCDNCYKILVELNK